MKEKTRKAEKEKGTQLTNEAGTKTVDSQRKPDTVERVRVRPSVRPHNLSAACSSSASSSFSLSLIHFRIHKLYNEFITLIFALIYIFGSIFISHANYQSKCHFHVWILHQTCCVFISKNSKKKQKRNKHFVYPNVHSALSTLCIRCRSINNTAHHNHMNRHRVNCVIFIILVSRNSFLNTEHVLFNVATANSICFELHHLNWTCFTWVRRAVLVYVKNTSRKKMLMSIPSWNFNFVCKTRIRIDKCLNVK